MLARHIVRTLGCCCLILAVVKAITTTQTNSISKPATSASASVSAVSLRNFSRSLVQCLASDDKVKCLQRRVIEGLDAAIQDNATWAYSDFILFEKNSTSDEEASATTAQQQQRQRQSRAISFTDTIGEKLLHLARARSVRLQLPPPQTLLRVPDGISDAVEALGSAATTAKPITIPINHAVFGGGLTDVAGLTNADEGRKKKDKDKTMASLGGMAMMAMMAQMFFGKVLLIAGTAFIMAKIALLVSLLGSLKKGSTGSGSGSTDHVIVTSAGSSSHGSPGWHRSMPYEVPKLEISHNEDEHYESKPIEYTHTSSGPPSHSPTYHKPPSSPPTGMSGPPTNYYNYEMAEGETDTSSDAGGGGGGDGFLRRNAAAGFL